MALKLETLFNQKSFDRVFTRQLDDVSCTPASLATIARLYEMPDSFDLLFFKHKMQTRFTGTRWKSIRDCVRECFPVKSTGVVYEDGIAYGSIRHKPEGDNHSVVFLAKRDRTLIYYDPFDHKIFRDDVYNMQRGSVRCYGTLWVANMPEIPSADFDFWNKRAVDNPYKLRDQVFWLKEHGHRKFPA